MNKPLAALGGLAATASVATPSILLTGGGSGSTGENQEPTKFQEPNWQNEVTKLSSSKDIKTKYKSIDCLKDRFGNIEGWDSPIDTNNNFSEAFQFVPTAVKGCLIVEHYKKEYTGGKWWGEFKLVLSLNDDNQRGLVTVVHAKTENEKLLVDSSIYVLSKNTDKWNLKSFKENTEQEASSENLSKLIPQPGSLIEEYKDTANQYWGFNPDLTKICKSDECKDVGSEGTKSSSIWESSLVSTGSVSVENALNNPQTWFMNNFNLDSTVTVTQPAPSKWTKRSGGN